MENGKSNGTSTQKKIYDVKMAQEYVIQPAKEFIQKFANYDYNDYLQDAYYHLRSNKIQFNLLEERMKNDVYNNDLTELEEIRDQYKDTIDKLEKPLNDYRQTVQEEVNKINIESLKKNYLSPDQLPFDEIKLSYEEPMIDLNTGKMIRETLLILQKHFEENNSSQKNDLEDFVTKLRQELQSVEREINLCTMQTSMKEQLNEAKESLEIFIEILQKIIKSKEI